MRNLKRALSLALATIMVFSMMVVGAGAVNLSDFSDKDKIANEEAVTVLTTLGVINGKDDGSYDPEGIVTRAEMAKMICIILNGGKDPQLGADVQSTYTDTVGHWAAGYIEYCTTLGIVSGRGNGTFDPNGTVTVAEAGKMVLVALGYNPSVEGYTGAQWQIKTDVRANQLKLYAGLGTLNTDVDLTRDNAAQMLYNALDVRMVEYSYAINGTADNAVTVKPQLTENTKRTLLYEKFGAVKVQGVVYGNEFANVKANKPDTEKAPAGVNIGTAQDAGKTLLLVTNYNGDLKFSKNDEQDVFSNKETTFSVATGENELGKSVWMYVKPGSTSLKSEVIGSVIISDENVIVKDASGDTTKEVADDNNLNLTSDTRYIYNYAGMTTTAPAKDGWKGVQKTLVDTDSDNNVDYVLYREMRLGKVTLLTESGDGQIVVNVNGDYTTTKGSFINKDKDDVMGFENVAKDDIVLAAYFGGKLHVQKAETVTGKIEAYKQTKDDSLKEGYRNTAFTVDAENYDVSRVDSYTGSDMTAAIQSVDKTILSSDATFYLDENGYVIAYGDVDESAYKYAYIWGAEAGGNISTDRVKATLEDGTTKTYDLSSNSDIDVVKTSTVADGKTVKTASIEESDMKGMVFAYTLTSGGDIKLYRAKTGTVSAEKAPIFNKGLTNIRLADSTVPSTIAYMTPYGLSSVSQTATYYSNNSTTFFYVSYKDNNPSNDIDKVTVYNGRNNAPSVDGTGLVGGASTVLALNAKGDVGAAVFSNVKVSESAGDHMFVYANSFVSEDYCLVDAFLNGSVEATKGAKASLYIENEVDHNPDIEDGLYLYTKNTDGYYELTKPDMANQSYYFEGIVSRVNKANNTFVITKDGSFKQECKITNDSIVVDNTLDTVVAVAGGNVTEGDTVKVIVNNADDSQVLMLGIMKHSEGGNNNGGPTGDWTLPADYEVVRVYNAAGDAKAINDIMTRATNPKDVVIEGNWKMAALDDLTIPAGRTLYVRGSLDASVAEINNRGVLKVNGKLTTDNGDVLAGDILAKNWDVTDSINTLGVITVEGTVTISNTKSLNVTTTSKLYAGDVTVAAGAGNSATLVVDGHVDVAGDVKVAGTITVKSANTLKVGGALETGTLNVGDAAHAGKVDAHSVSATNVNVNHEDTVLTVSTLIKTDNFTQSEGTVKVPTIAKITTDVAIIISGGTTTAKVEDASTIAISGGAKLDAGSNGVVKASTSIIISGGATLEAGPITAPTVTVTDSTLKAAKLTGDLAVASTLGKTVTVSVPTLVGDLDTSAVAGSGNVNAGTSSDSDVGVAGDIKANVTLTNADFNGDSEITIAKGVTVTLKGTVTGLDNLKGTDDSSMVKFEKGVTVTGDHSKYVDAKGQAIPIDYFSGLGFTWKDSKFVNNFGTIYTVAETASAILDSSSIYA